MTDFLWDVFISHSTKSRPDGTAAQLLTELLDRFPLGACRVRADRDFLLPGDEWNPKIRDVINESHLGFVLLDDKALESRWVRRETRQMLDQPREKKYRVIAVLIDLDRQDVLDSGHEELIDLVSDLQTMSIQPSSVSDAVSKLVELLRLNVLGRLSEREMSLVQKVAYCLPNDPRMLAKIHRRLDERTTLAPLLAKEDLAYRILCSRLGVQLRMMFAGTQDEFRQVRADDRERLAELLEPSWIEFESAQRVIDETPAPGRVCVLGTANPVPDAESTGICVATGANFVYRATHWDNENVRVHKAVGEVPTGEPWEVGPLLRKQYRWNDYQTNYFVLQAGQSRSSRLSGVRAAQAVWPGVVVVLVIGPDADPDREDFKKHLGENYCHAVVEHQAELDAIDAMDDIRSHLNVERTTR